MILELSRPLRRAWRLSDRLYALSLIDFSQFKGSGVPAAPFGLDSEAITEFVFDINPKSLDLDEPAAVTIIPTQNKGVYTENQGSIFKDVRITGTTGLRPKMGGRGAIIPIANVPSPFGETDKETMLPVGEETGFDVFIKLRNLFRTYASLKTNPKYAHSIAMVWQNGHEGDFFIVEPINFRTSRASGSPLTFNYDIQLKTVGTLDNSKSSPWRLVHGLGADPLKDAETTFNTRVNNFANDLKQYTSLLGASVYRINNIVGHTAVSLLGVPNQVILDMSNVLSGVSNTMSIPRGLVAYEATKIRNFVEDFNEFRRTAKDEYYSAKNLVTEYSQVSKNFLSLSRVLNAIANTPQLTKKPSINGQVANAKSAYKSPINGTLPSSSAANLENMPIPSGTQRSKVNGSETIQVASLRLLGDAARWKELAILNNLKAPYISEDGDGVSVLRPGDTILVPSFGDNGGASSVRDAIDELDDEDPLTRSLGRDLKLERVAKSGNFGLFDLAVGDNGDLAKVAGVDNFTQAVELRFSIERGDLPTHPTYGLAMPIGTKGSVRSMLAYNIDARANLLSDSRVSEITKLDFSVEGETVRVNAKVRAQNVDNSLSVRFSRGR